MKLEGRTHNAANPFSTHSDPMAGKKGMKHARPRTGKDRDSYAASRIEQMLDDHREGKIKLDSGQLKAIEIRYSRLRPMLSAIEQTVIDPRDKQEPADLEAKMRALFDSNPELFAFLQANAPQQTPVEDPEKRVTH